ncbi:MAG: heavy metal translocating P-type ATPase metal-binding domain-containing protein [Bacteroidota bacterium]
MIACFHCGDECDPQGIIHKEKHFCCKGCKTVYDILNDNDLSYYYDLDENPGISPQQIQGKFDFLNNESISGKLLEFNDGTTAVVSFLIPSMHCSSCIWVLENLSKLNSAVKTSRVNFPEKTVRITFSSSACSLQDLVILLAKIGYEPYISLEDANERIRKKDYSLVYKIGVAGFAFGNVMFLSFPEYFEVNEFWLERFKYLFRWLMFAFSLPVVFYAGWDYFTSAFKGLRSKILNIDVPIALGIAVLFIRSTLDIIFNWGTGFFDSLTGLIFFLLLGKFFQQKTYAHLSFERDYKSYFPMAVTRLIKDKKSGITSEEQTHVNDIEPGDRILIRNEELIPVDAILLKGNALIDYSFVTGEAQPVPKRSGDLVFAGGRQTDGMLEVEVVKTVEQSYLTQLWSNDAFSKKKGSFFQTLTDRISKRFTVTVLSIAFMATTFWMFYDITKAFHVFTAVLIIACPCAIALAAPFTLGNLLRIFGSHKFYLKEASVIEKMAEIDTVVFDKTGTLTTHQKSIITYEGMELSEDEVSLLHSSLRASNHPLSRALYEVLDRHDILTLDEFEEKPGKGISASVANLDMKLGSYSFVEGANTSEVNRKTTVHISSNNTYKGCFLFHQEYRPGVSDIFKNLAKDNELIILSGDNDGERAHLAALLPEGTKLHFDQRPEDKLNFVKHLQQQGKKVMMVGDGLNDAGALKQSNIGVVVSENVNVFSPACDAILDASRFGDLTQFFRISRRGVDVIRWSFILSLLYNLTGLAFAVTGHLKPIVAAILMPLSSVSVVVFTTVLSQIISKKLHVKNSS